MKKAIFQVIWQKTNIIIMEFRKNAIEKNSRIETEIQISMHVNSKAMGENATLEKQV